MMKQAFPSIVEPDFTANVESLLDMVEEGKVSWKTVVSNFYPDLEEAVKKAEEDMEKDVYKRQVWCLTRRRKKNRDGMSAYL